MTIPIELAGWVIESLLVVVVGTVVATLVPAVPTSRPWRTQPPLPADIKAPCVAPSPPVARPRSSVVPPPPPPRPRHERSSKAGGQESAPNQGQALGERGGLAQVQRMPAPTAARRSLGGASGSQTGPAGQIGSADVYVRPASPMSNRERACVAVGDAIVASQGVPGIRPLLGFISPELDEVLLEQPMVRAPHGWILTADGQVLRRRKSTERSQPGGPPESPIPLSLGAATRDGQAFLDLRCARVVGVTGDRERALEWLRGAATELEDVGSRVLTVGTTWSSSTGDASVRWDDVERMLGEVPREPGPHASSLVVVSDSAPPQGMLAELIASDVALIAAGTLGLGQQIEVGSDVLRLADLGLTFPLRADATPTQSADEVDRAGSPLGCRHLPTPPVDPVLVRLLGPIGLPGVDGLRSKALAVVAYLAHRRSATSEAVQDACWEPGVRRTHKLLKDVLSEARSVLGTAHLPVAQGSNYVAGPGLVTDTQLFDAHLASAEASTSVRERAEILGCALELPTGPVFTYPSRAAKSFGWIDDENLLSYWELRIERAAAECARLWIDLDDPDEALTTLRNALQALPLSAELTEMLMRAHAAHGQAGAVDAVYRAHVASMARALQDSPERSTTDLHRELTGASRH